MTLEERVKEWPAQWLREGREQGLAQGLEQGLEQGREQGRKQGREEGLEQGREQGREEGLEQGLEQGREQGLEHERTLLRRMAALRFGAETGERAAALMAYIGEADQLADAGDWLVQAGASDEFLARVASIARS